MQSIRIEKEFYEIRDQFSSAKAEINVMNDELSEASGLYKQVVNLKKKIAELGSDLEITRIERDMFKAELEGLRPGQQGIQKRG